MSGKILIPLIAAAVLIVHPFSSGQTETVRFAIIGDRTGGHEEGVYGSVLEEVLRLRPEFIMTVGDMIEGYTEDTTRLIEEWQEYLEIIESVDVPLHHTPGNHDLTFDAMRPLYERYIGQPYYSVDHGPLHLVVVDNSTGMGGNPSELDDEQLGWLDQDLGSVEEGMTVLLFCHKPFWYNTLGRGLADPLHEFLLARGVDAVFSGHFHRYFSGAYDGIKYTCVGSSGGGIDDHPLDFGYQFAWVTVGDDRISIAPIKAGAVLPWEEVRTEEMFLSSTYDRVGIDLIEPMPVSESGCPVLGSTRVIVRNPHPELSIADTLRWEVPEGWHIEPSRAPYRMGPGDSAIIDVKIESADDLYPLPTALANLPLRPGRTYPVRKQLPVARSAQAVKCSGPMSIDGAIDEAAWSEPVTLLYGADGRIADVEKTAIYFAWDASNLYVAAECRESVPDSIHSEARKRDGAVYYDDCIGLFLAPDPEGDTVYQIYVSPAGVIFDQLIVWDESNWYTASREFDGSYEVGVGQGSDRWVVEVRLPLEELRATVDDSPWGLNFRRKQQRLGAVADWQVPVDYSPDTYGRLFFRR